MLGLYYVWSMTCFFIHIFPQSALTDHTDSGHTERIAAASAVNSANCRLVCDGAGVGYCR